MLQQASKAAESHATKKLPSPRRVRDTQISRSHTGCGHASRPQQG